MRCSNCATDNPADGRFCISCGKALVPLCLSCGAENVSTARYCAQCGTSLQVYDAAAHAKSPQALGAERRHLTVLFCELVGSSAFAAQMDPEDWRAALAAYHRVAGDAMRQFGGHVAKYLGNGLMAFFGYPEAHENDAERAVRAGLALLAAISKLNESETHPTLSARIGVDSGAVVVGTGATQDPDVFGDVPNIAARVQSFAGNGNLMISGNTYRLITGFFILEDQGPQILKGITTPLRLYRVEGPSGARNRLEAFATVQGLTPFVGREDELRTLIRRWERVREGDGQVILISGEAGIGKSRLVQRFHEEIANTSHSWIECAAVPYHQNTPFSPVAEMLRESLHTSREHSASEQLAQLSPRLAAAGLDPSKVIPLLARLLDIAIPTQYQPPVISPDQERRTLLATLVEWVVGSARLRPSIILIEDLHWADPSTSQLLQMLAEQGTHSPLLLLYTARPEVQMQWFGLSHHTHITLNRLRSRETQDLIAAVAHQHALEKDVIDSLMSRSGGVPFFIEELTRSVIEGTNDHHSIPSSLQDSLMSRLDRLGAAKEILQIGAVIGREFSYSLLYSIQPYTDTVFQSALAILTRAQLLFVRGIPPDSRYTFKHALIQDIAYEALLKTRRRELHHEIAKLIVGEFSDLGRSHPELLARHWAAAGDLELAVEQWRLAGAQAQGKSAHSEAINHLTKALKLLEELPHNEQRAQSELFVQVSLASSLMTIKGYGAPEVERAFARAAELCQRMGESVWLFSVLRGLHRFHLVRANHAKAFELAQQCAAIAAGLKDSDLMLEGEVALGESSVYMGDIRSSELHLTQAIAHYDPSQHRPEMTRNVQDPSIAANAHLALVMEVLGYPDKAMAISHKVISEAKELSHPFSSVYALNSTAWLHSLRRETSLCEQYIEESLQQCQKFGFSLFAAQATVYRGWSLAQQGDAAKGIVYIHKGIEAWQSTGAALLRPLFFVMLASSCLLAGLLDDASVAISAARTAAQVTKEQMYWPEILRLDAEIRLLNEEDNDGFEKVIGESIESARRQQAKLWELRASMSLGRHLASIGRRDEAYSMMLDICRWYDNASSTPDLEDARVLCDRLYDEKTESS